MNLLIITGTDTGVGKTIVTASLGKALRADGIDVVVRKPFASGVRAGSPFEEDDALLLAAAAGSEESLETIRPASFQSPLAPCSTARLESRAVDLAGVLANVQACAALHAITLVEGVGGAAVPLCEGVLFSDFARKLGAPVLVVARSGLGTVNSTLLTIEHLRARQIPLAGVVFVRSTPGALTLAEETGPGLVTEFSGVENFGLVDYSQELARAASLQEAVRALPAASPPIGRIAAWLVQNGAPRLP